MQWNMTWSIELQETYSFVVSTGTVATLQVCDLQTQEFCVNSVLSHLLYKRKEKESMLQL